MIESPNRLMIQLPHKNEKNDMVNVASEAMGVLPEDLRDNSLLRLNRTQFQKPGDSPLLLTFFAGRSH